MPPALLAFLKSNAKFLYGTGIVGAAFAAGDIKKIADSDNKFTALLKTLWDLVKIKIAFAGTMTAIGKGLQAVIRETGSLEAALKKLQSTQMAARGLAPFVGGLEAARKKIAELYVVASKSPFKFEDIAEANKSLAVFTKGAYSSTEAIKTLAAAATGAGSNVEDVANAVGMFYDNLASGQPVDRSAESLRQLGVISNTTTQHLVAMSEGGASITSIMSELDAALRKGIDSSKGYGDEIASVTAEHQKAIDAFKEAIGAPFTSTEIKNTQNMSAAMRAFTPVAGQVSQSLAVVFKGIGTATSSLAKFAAQSKTVQTIFSFFAKSIEVAGVALTVFGLIAIPAALKGVASLAAGIGNLAESMGVASKVASGLTVAVGGIGTVAVGTFALAGITALVGMMINAKREAHESDQKFKDWKKSLRDTTTSIEQQITSIQSLADQHAALNAILDDQIRLEKELAKQRGTDKARDPGDKTKLQRLEAQRRIESGESGGIRGSERRIARLDKEIAQEKTKIRLNDEAVKKRKEQYSEATKLNPVEAKLIAAEVRKNQLIEEQTLGVDEREKRARTGAQAAAASDQARAKIDAGRIYQEKELEKDKITFRRREKLAVGKGGMTEEEKTKTQADFNDRQSKIDRLKKDSIQAAISISEAQGEAGKKSSAYLGAQLEQMDAARQATEKEIKLKTTTDPKERKELEEQIKALKELSGGAVGTPTAIFEKRKEIEKARAREAEAPELAARKPIVAAEKVEFETETARKEARATGDVRKAFRLEDFGKYLRTLEELKPAYGKEAPKMAKERTEAEIKEQYAQASNVVGYMQSIGGGGGLPQQGVDLQRRMVELLSSINEYNKKMAEPEQPDQQGQQGSPAFFFNP